MRPSLHEALTSLPLAAWCDIEVTALAVHPIRSRPSADPAPTAREETPCPTSTAASRSSRPTITSGSSDRFHYAWLQDPGYPGHNAFIGDYKMLRQDWGPRRLFREFHGQNVIKSVHVEADYSGPDPVEETIWLESVAAEFGMPNAIVAYADLERDGAEAELDRHLAASDRVRGVRIRSHPGRPGYRRVPSGATRRSPSAGCRTS